MKAAVVPATLLAAASFAASARADGVEVLPDVSVHLSAARYVPVERDMHWQGWIGAGAGILRVERVTAFVSGDVETIIGNSLRAFEANQANYHLEAGLRRPFGRATATLALHHVSRHYVDRPKIQAVDWNVLGARLALPVGEGAHATRLTVGLGHTTLASLVGYRWEATARLEAEPVPLGAPRLFAVMGARAVTIDPDPLLPRDDFLDLAAEAGVRWRKDGRVLDLFASLERRHDVFLEVPGSRDRGLVAFRVSYLR